MLHILLIEEVLCTKRRRISFNMQYDKYAKEYFTMKIKGQETPSPERFVNT